MLDIIINHHTNTFKKKEPPVPQQKKKPLPTEVPKDAVEDDDVVDWMPPQDQSGDGKTKLNKLYGY
jgi:hypothetical protein